jgi:hypothetical protein
MKVNLNNKIEIEKVLNEVQTNRMTTHLVTYEKILEEKKYFEKVLTNKLPKKYWNNCFLDYCEQMYSKAYTKRSFTAQSTYFRILVLNNNFYLTKCSREKISALSYKDDNKIFYTHRAVKYMLEKQLKKYNIHHFLSSENKICQTLDEFINMNNLDYYKKGEQNT